MSLNENQPALLQDKSLRRICHPDQVFVGARVENVLGQTGSVVFVGARRNHNRLPRTVKVDYDNGDSGIARSGALISIS